MTIENLQVDCTDCQRKADTLTAMQENYDELKREKDPNILQIEQNKTTMKELLLTSLAATASPDESLSSENIETNQELQETLPINWEKIFDEASGESFYYNNTTGESRWEPPPPMPTSQTTAPVKNEKRNQIF